MLIMFSISFRNQFITSLKRLSNVPKRCMSKEKHENESTEFESVYKFPSIKYIALLNRLKVYHFAGSSIAVPSCGVLEMMSVIPEQTFLATFYIGLTAGCALLIPSILFHNVIGFLYISKDNKNIKISSVDFWGKRINKIIPVSDWIPLLDLPPRTMDAVYMSPHLRDGTKYRFFIKFGTVLNPTKIGQYIE
ncbi:transmembrane protein 186 [Achroia grisella]|uniref:transmembrane protein 186 n=1 Tax=Achroia grisella TaxID=688607 RepID=UPI0027D2A221|nr:transmembrane protein 186 [Achroia grisella]